METPSPVSPPPLRGDIVAAMQRIATEQSAEYAIEHMRLAKPIAGRNHHLKYALSRAKIEGGLTLEFGVAKGKSITVIANLVFPEKVYGFDSFQGLPEDWTMFQSKGRFSSGGKPPQIGFKNVEFVVGEFIDTIPVFCGRHPENISFLHVDSDLYTSAKTVLSGLSDRIVRGTVIVFDEFFNYPGWQRHEARAFVEWCMEDGVEFEYISFAANSSAVGVLIR